MTGGRHPDRTWGFYCALLGHRLVRLTLSLSIFCDYLGKRLLCRSDKLQNKRLSIFTYAACYYSSGRIAWFEMFLSQYYNRVNRKLTFIRIEMTENTTPIFILSVPKKEREKNLLVICISHFTLSYTSSLIKILKSGKRCVTNRTAQ